MKNIARLLTICLLGTTLFVSDLNAAELKKVESKSADITKTSATLNADEILKLLKAKFPTANIEYVALAEVDNLYSFMLEGDLYYISNDGQYLVKGQLLDISTPKVRNLSRERITELEKKKSPMRLAEINKLDEETMVVYEAPNEKHVVTIFTDVDCGFCQKLHKERQAYLDLGITLRYLAFPRAGLDSASADKLRGIWCADDPQLAMTEAKLQNKYREGRCKTPFKEHMALVRKFGLGGTPGIILENGDLIGGYLPAEILNKRLDEAAVSTNAVAGKE